MSDQEPFVFLAFGMFFIVIGMIQTYLRKVWLRGGGWIYRDKQPIQYWLTIATCYLGGGLCIAISLYGVHILSH
jgi:hypothetical protein